MERLAQAPFLQSNPHRPGPQRGWLSLASAEDNSLSGAGSQGGISALQAHSKQLLALPRQGDAHVPYKDPRDITMTCNCAAPEEAAEARAA